MGIESTAVALTVKRLCHDGLSVIKVVKHIKQQNLNQIQPFTYNPGVKIFSFKTLLRSVLETAKPKPYLETRIRNKMEFKFNEPLS